jgi:hypothetical protein
MRLVTLLLALAVLVMVVPDIVAVTVTPIVAMTVLAGSSLEMDNAIALPPGKAGPLIEPLPVVELIRLT